MTIPTADAKAQYSAIVLGATGNVGGRIVRLLINSPLCRKVVVVTRRKTGAFTDPKVSEVVVDMDRLGEELAPHAQGVDIALAAFGVGKGSAQMPDEEVRKIEVSYPREFCRAAKAGGARVCGMMTAVSADPGAGMKYARIIGEKEKAVEAVGFDFLGVYRPSVILGNSNTPGMLGTLMRPLDWVMPSKYHSIHKNDLARAMVAQSEQAFLALAQGDAPREAAVKILEYREMQPFFVKGESAEP
ncbi:MAG TPA: NAD(P)H-binding protein [Burkholderiales bacterium]|nr:NAD(P)H-binding protein [Burkholderiales bacterium]